MHSRFCASASDSSCRSAGTELVPIYAVASAPPSPSAPGILLRPPSTTFQRASSKKQHAVSGSRSNPSRGVFVLSHDGAISHCICNATHGHGFDGQYCLLLCLCRPSAGARCHYWCQGHALKQAFWQKSGNDRAFFWVGLVKKIARGAILKCGINCEFLKP